MELYSCLQTLINAAFCSLPACLPACRVAAEEEESAMAERRQDLFTLFRNAASLTRPEAYRFVGGLLSAALSQPQQAAVPWQDVEVAVSLLYQLGEAAPEADMKPGSGVLAQVAAGVMLVSGPATLCAPHTACHTKSCAPHTPAAQTSVHPAPPAHSPPTTHSARSETTQPLAWHAG